MEHGNDSTAPLDAQKRRSVEPVICYPTDSLTPPDLSAYRAAREGWRKVDEIVVPPRDARSFEVPAGCFFRILSIEGAQVGDLNLWAAADINERFFSGKTRALHGTHLSTGDRLWSCLPYLRPMATITQDTLDWYGFDEWGCSVHDVIGTRCDPYTHRLLSGEDYHHCCHSNLTRALARHLDLPRQVVEPAVHDVLNVFMCTGFKRDTGQYLMKASPRQARRLPGILCGDRSSRRIIGLPWRRLQHGTFERCCRLLPSQDRNLPAGRSAHRVEGRCAQSLCGRPRFVRRVSILDARGGLTFTWKGLLTIKQLIGLLRLRSENLGGLSPAPAETCVASCTPYGSRWYPVPRQKTRRIRA